jgi:hypothetical protein
MHKRIMMMRKRRKRRRAVRTRKMKMGVRGMLGR